MRSIFLVALKKIIIFTIFFYQFSVFATEQQKDPLNSPSWNEMHKIILNAEPVIFDDRIEVSIPSFAEDPTNVPITIKVKDIKKIEEIIVFADLNPIQKVLSFKPFNIKPSLSFRIKVEQSTPVRAGVKTSDGIWHVGGRWLEAAGG